MPLDTALAERVRDAVIGHGITSEKKMFGGISFMRGDAMAIGVVNSDLVIRYDPAREAEVMARPGARPMDFTGRPMSGWAFVAGEKVDDEAMKQWVAESISWVATLPPSKKPARKAKTG